jgi:hypothetical protein
MSTALARVIVVSVPISDPSAVASMSAARASGSTAAATNTALPTQTAPTSRCTTTIAVSIAAIVSRAPGAHFKPAKAGLSHPSRGRRGVR